MAREKLYKGRSDTWRKTEQRRAIPTGHAAPEKACNRRITETGDDKAVSVSKHIARMVFPNTQVHFARLSMCPPTSRVRAPRISKARP